MKGIVIGHSSHGNIDCLIFEDIQTNARLKCYVDKLDKSYVGKIVNIHTTVTEIVNSDFNHVYPEGTIGTS